MAKKKLDELFREKFQDFHETPDEKVWQSLEAALNKKEKSRKVIPFWWKLGGAAAVLLAGIWLINPFSTETGNSQNPITTVEQDTNQVDSKQESKIPLQKQMEEGNNGIVDTNEDTPSNMETSDPTSPENEAYTANGKEVREQGVQDVDKKTDSFKKLAPALQKNRTKVADADGSEEKGAESRSDRTVQQLPQKSGNAVANATDAKNLNTIESIKSPSEKTTEGIAENALDTDNKGQGTKEEVDAVLKGALKDNDTNTIAVNDTVPDTKKKSIFDEIKVQEEEEELVAENSNSRWSAGASIAPVFYSSFGEGSPVHSIFVENSKSGETNLSYGLSIAYELNSRLSVRSGIHKVDYGYGTDDIAFSSSLQGSATGQIDNIDYAANSRSLVVQSKAGPTSQGVNDNFDLQPPLDVNAPQATRDGTMSQQFEYLEIPLELNYALIDKKFGVNLIGGVSSLFLIDNSVSLTSGNQTLEMGEANNINSVNFSTNVGLGFDYDFSPKVKLNIEPVFKYQLNTFSDVDGTFQPFSVGIYSGLSFRF